MTLPDVGPVFDFLSCEPDCASAPVLALVFTESAPRQIKSVSCNVRFSWVVCSLSVTFYLRGRETSSVRGSSFNWPNKN